MRHMDPFVAHGGTRSATKNWHFKRVSHGMLCALCAHNLRMACFRVSLCVAIFALGCGGRAGNTPGTGTGSSSAGVGSGSDTGSGNAPIPASGAGSGDIGNGLPPVPCYPGGTCYGNCADACGNKCTGGSCPAGSGMAGGGSTGSGSGGTTGSVVGSSGSGPATCTDASAQTILASNFDQSCKTDSDCIAVAEGTAFPPCCRSGACRADLSCQSAPAGTSDAGWTTIAECQALATSFANNCNSQLLGDARAPDTQRACIWTTYAQICKTGNAQVLLDSMKCFGDNKACMTFSDSNGAAPCLAKVHTTGESAAALTFLNKVCTECGGTKCMSQAYAGLAELFPYVSDAELAVLDACRASACTNAELIANCSSVPDVAGIFACK